MDSKPKCKIIPDLRTKIHELCYILVNEEEDVQVLATSTEDGRVLFYSTRPADLTSAESAEGKDTPLPSAKLIAQLGGKDVGLSGRIKDFTVLHIGEGASKEFIIVAGGSDGALRLWRLAPKNLASHSGKTKQIGTLLGTYETTNRITCLKAFVMLPKMEGVEDEAIEDFEGLEDEEEASSSSDSE